MTGKHHLYIIEMDGQTRVRPAIASVDCDKRPEVSIRNLTKNDWTIEFDAAMLPAGGARQVQIAQGETKPITLRGSASGFFTYKVWRQGPGNVRIEAVGESVPGMILDP